MSAFPANDMWANDIWDAMMRETSTSGAEERREIHNTSVDEQVALARLCAHVHLPSGRTCALPAAHSGSCDFKSPDQARRVAERKLN